jgi:S-adenosylmethionine hydrolase
MATVQPIAEPIISLMTDFGQSEGYVGAMQGVILSICPNVRIITLSHDIPPQNIQAGAFVLYQAFRYYPAHTVHCAVVDPGVGSRRRAIALRTQYGLFVGPDNGLFSLILKNSELLEAVTLTNPQYQRPQVSATFHGRDIFAPAAAYLAAGLPMNKLGSPLTDPVQLDFRTGLETGQSKIIQIDHFGNIILDITAADIPDKQKVTFTIGRTIIKGLKQTFADVEEGQFLAYVGSTYDHIEIARRNGNAAQALELQWGDVVQIKL